MIPRIANVEAVPPLYQEYLAALSKQGFEGDIEDRYASRLLCATDNSVYQCMPKAVLFPKSEEDIVKAVKLACNERFLAIKFVPRGGGTGTNGQSLNHGIVIDCSRHLKKIGQLDEENRLITVQSGVIKDELNEKIKDAKLFFSPELSTSSRATIGGMISNDAAGQGSLQYGRTSAHIVAVRMVLSDGSVETFKTVSGDELQECLKKEGTAGKIYRTAYELLKEAKPKVKETFPKLNRFLTGYDLDHGYDEKTDALSLQRIICGAEGTLGFITEAILDLTPLPAFRALVTVKYKDFDSALRHAPLMVAAGALSVETVDSKVLNLAKQDPVWVGASPYIREVEGAQIEGVNIVEFAGDDEAEQRSLLQAFYEKVTAQAQDKFAGGVLGAQIVDTPEGINAVYAMRKKSVGLLGAAHGRKKLVAFTEDTVVPPQNLADYILEFRALLDSMQVPYGMFGHVDTGLMHVRPGLDLTTDQDKEKLVKISRAVVQLVRKYQGQMWGEHGRGYRSVFGELFFKDLYPVCRKLKALFDPLNRINPGKICVPYGNDDDSLADIDGPMRGDLDRTLPLNVQESFTQALACNGNGQCFSYQKSALMCPSYRYTKDHVRSPKGYSALMREWLRLMVERGCDPLPEEIEALSAHRLNPIGFIRRAYNTITCKDDFNHEFLENIKTCLACKSCKTQCPAHVNAADLNSRFLSLYYGRYLRPLMDLAVLNAEWLIPALGRIPRLSNFMIKNKLAARFNEKIMGLVDIPLLDEKNLLSEAKREKIPYLSLKRAMRSGCELLIVVDPFTAAYDVQGLMSFAKLCRFLGVKVGFLRPYINGKLLIVRGDRAQFIAKASKQAARLQLLSDKGIALVGYDPALTICYRDEYPVLLGKARGTFEVLLPEEWLMQALKDERKLSLIKNKIKGSVNLAEPYYLFCHCTEHSVVPEAVHMWQQILKAFNLSLLPVPVSCCGMAGLHGHMARNRDESYTVYRNNWQGELRKRDFNHCLVTGFSCRSQVKRMEGRAARHPVQILCDSLDL